MLHDLQSWVEQSAPQTATVFIGAFVIHKGGDYYANGRLHDFAKQKGKNIVFKFLAERWIENRLYYRNQSEVLWPATFPDDEGVAEYVKMLTDAGRPPQKRYPGSTPKNGIFSGEEGRAALECAMLKAGVRVRSMCSMLKETARPLGYFNLKTLGFGSTFVTYRNCANNCPLAFWPGNPWYPLFRRKTN